MTCRSLMPEPPASILRPPAVLTRALITLPSALWPHPSALPGPCQATAIAHSVGQRAGGGPGWLIHGEARSWTQVSPGWARCGQCSWWSAEPRGHLEAVPTRALRGILGQRSTWTHFGAALSAESQQAQSTPRPMRGGGRREPANERAKPWFARPQLPGAPRGGPAAGRPREKPQRWDTRGQAACRGM